MTQKISSPGVLLHISVLEESVHDSQCVVAAELREAFSVIFIDVSTTVFANHAPSYSDEFRERRAAHLPRALLFQDPFEVFRA